MNKRIVKIQNIIDNKKYIEIFDEEIKKIVEIPKMPKCEFIHIGATSIDGLFGEEILDILVVVENLHEITTFDEKRLNNIGYHRIAHSGVKGVIKYARIVDYFTMDYNVVLHIVQRDTQIHKDYLLFSELLKNENVQKKYNEFKNNCANYSFKEYSNRKIEFINKLLEESESK